MSDAILLALARRYYSRNPVASYFLMKGLANETETSERSRKLRALAVLDQSLQLPSLRWDPAFERADCVKYVAYSLVGPLLCSPVPARRHRLNRLIRELAAEVRLEQRERRCTR